MKYLSLIYIDHHELEAPPASECLAYAGTPAGRVDIRPALERP